MASSYGGKGGQVRKWLKNITINEKTKRLLSLPVATYIGCYGLELQHRRRFFVHVATGKYNNLFLSFLYFSMIVYYFLQLPATQKKHYVTNPGTLTHHPQSGLRLICNCLVLQKFMPKMFCVKWHNVCHQTMPVTIMWTTVQEKLRPCWFVFLQLL